MKLFQNQSNFFLNRTARLSPALSYGKKLSSVLEHAANRADEQKQVFQQRKDELSLTNTKSAAKTSSNVIYKTEWEPQELSADKIPGYISDQMKNYRNQVGSAVDNLNYNKERILYLEGKVKETEQLKNGEFSEAVLAEIETYRDRYNTEQEWQDFQNDYKAYLQQEASDQYDSYKQQLEKSCRDVEDVLKDHLDMASGFVRFGQLVYGDKVYEKVTDVMGSFVSDVEKDDFKLDTAGKSVADVMDDIDRVVGNLKDLADRIGVGYEDYTGRTLGNYQYQDVKLSHEDKSRMDHQYMLSKELGQNKDPRYKIAGVDNVRISTDDLKPAVNHLNRKA